MYVINSNATSIEKNYYTETSSKGKNFYRNGRNIDS